MAVKQSEVDIYKRHVDGGESMRSIARSLGVQPSTILRRIRRVEDLRSDDPNFDTAIDDGDVQTYFRKREVIQDNNVALRIIRDSRSSPKLRMGLDDSHIATLKQAHMDIAMVESVDDPLISEIIKPLGPLMAEVIIRVCRTQEGIEIIEKKVGISARSGKIVLKCALECLKRTTYADT